MTNAILMTASFNSESSQPKEPLVDLSELENLQFGPNWRNSKTQQIEKSKPSLKEGKPSGKSGKKDRRPLKRGPKTHGFSEAPREQQPLEHSFEITFYPEDVPFQALTKAIRQSCRTYELFEIAQLILEKSDRFVVVLKIKQKDKEAKQPIYYAVPDKTPFETEEAAIAYVLKNHACAFFKTETIEVEAPKGNFTSINKCSITGELIGPPNYHRYQQLLQEHYGSKVSHIPFEKFSSKITSEKDPEVIQQWVQKMTKETRYTPVGLAEGEEAPKIESIDAARHYLLSKHKDKVVRQAESVRFSGKQLDLMPTSTIKQAVFQELEHQRKFPLDTANNLRGRLRRMHFNIYKKGSKGISYVSAVKRKFREENTLFAEPIQKLIEFLDGHPSLPLTELPQKYLGLDEAIETIQDNPEAKEMMINLRWLITEGYVIEYGNNTLLTTPLLPKQKKKEEENSALLPSNEKVEEPLIVTNDELSAQEDASTKVPESAQEEETTPEVLHTTQDA